MSEKYFPLPADYVLMQESVEKSPEWVKQELKNQEIEAYVNVFNHQQDIIGTPQQEEEYPTITIFKEK